MLVESVEEKIRLTGCSNHKSGTERREAGDPTSTRSFDIFTGRGSGLEPLLAVLKPIEDYIFESLDAVPFFSHGRPALKDSSTRAGDRGKAFFEFSYQICSQSRVRMGAISEHTYCIRAICGIRYVCRG